MAKTRRWSGEGPYGGALVLPEAVGHRLADVAPLPPQSPPVLHEDRDGAVFASADAERKFT